MSPPPRLTFSRSSLHRRTFPPRDLENIVFTPHLGASTAEAQENVGIEIAQAIRAALLDGEIRNAVNMPSMDAKTAAIVKPYLTLGRQARPLRRSARAKPQ